MPNLSSGFVDYGHEDVRLDVIRGIGVRQCRARGSLIEMAMPFVLVSKHTTRVKVQVRNELLKILRQREYIVARLDLVTEWTASQRRLL